MKKFLSAIVAAGMLFMPMTSYAAQDINLPTVQANGKLSVMQALSQRKSDRNFVEKDLTPAQLAKILWAANGTNRPDGKRVNPAGKGVYSVEVYAVTREGIYLYYAANHKLKLIAEGDYRLIAANGIYNCGTGHAHTFNEVGRAMIESLGLQRLKITYCDFPDELRGKYQSFTEADMKKLAAAGYKEGFTNFVIAVEEYCKFLEAGGYYSIRN